MLEQYEARQHLPPQPLCEWQVNAWEASGAINTKALRNTMRKDSGLCRRFIFACVAIFLASVGGLHGAGMWMYERGTPEVGTANAGVAARAEDAATALNNPAGMTRLEDGQVMLGLQPLILNIQFAPDSNTTTTGSAGNADDILPALGAYYAQPIGERWSVGFSLASYFGLGVAYEDDWVGRYYLQETSFLTLSGSPTAGFKVNDWLAFGAGIPLQYADFKLVSAVNRPAALPDGQMTFEDNSFGIGGLLSVLLQPAEATRIGVSYVTPVEHSFKETPQISGLPLNPPETGIDVTIPQSVVGSVHQELGERWALMGNVGWQNWRQFGQMIIGFDGSANRAVVIDRNFRDTWHFAIGGHYRFHDDWRLTAGFAYDTSPVSDEDRTADMPFDRQLRYSLGALWEVNERWRLGLGYTLLDLGSAQLSQSRAFAGTLSGDYSRNLVHVISLNANWQF